jgi:hypothetical protein
MTLRHWVTASGVPKKRIAHARKASRPLNRMALHLLQTSGTDYPATQHFIPEERNTQTHLSENFKIRITLFVITEFILIVCCSL